jgi:hypothetical protein
MQPTLPVEFNIEKRESVVRPVLGCATSASCNKSNFHSLSTIRFKVEYAALALAMISCKAFSLFSATDEEAGTLDALAFGGLATEEAGAVAPNSIGGADGDCCSDPCPKLKEKEGESGGGVGSNVLAEHLKNSERVEFSSTKYIENNNFTG